MSDDDLHVCTNLRFNGYTEDLDDLAITEIVFLNQVPYMCLRTSQPWGIDDEPAVPERCRPGRSCFNCRK